MKLSQKTLENLRDMINEKTAYRSGPKLVALFKQYGFNDVYGQGFPSRSSYTYRNLELINGCPELDKCIKDIFAPINFIGEENKLISCVTEFNKYLAFEGWEITVQGRDIVICHCEGPNIAEEIKRTSDISGCSENDFLIMEFKDVDIEKLPITHSIKSVLSSRMSEIENCFIAKAYLSTIILSGSVLEGILLGIGQNNPKQFNQSKCAPRSKDTDKPKDIREWNLCELINTANDLGIIKEDVKEFSHNLRDFRNYIHPFQQMATNFFPDEHTAKICLQVLKAAICQIYQTNIGK